MNEFRNLPVWNSAKTLPLITKNPVVLLIGGTTFIIRKKRLGGGGCKGPGLRPRNVVVALWADDVNALGISTGDGQRHLGGVEALPAILRSCAGSLLPHIPRVCLRGPQHVLFCVPLWIDVLLRKHTEACNRRPRHCRDLCPGIRSRPATCDRRSPSLACFGM